MKKIKYFLFYFKFTKWKGLLEDLTFASYQVKKSKIWIVFDMLKSAYINGTAFNEYFYFRFFEKTNKEKDEWVGSEMLYEFQLAMNPKKHRYLVADKSVFLKEYEPFTKRRWLKIDSATSEDQIKAFISQSPLKKAVFKNAKGKTGSQVKVLDLKSTHNFLAYTKKAHLDLIEEYVVQHNELNRISPTSLNTVRIMTWINNEGRVQILGAVLRASIGADIDNMSQGGFAAPINIETGEIIGPGVFLSLVKPSVYIHPITKTNLIGFKIPYWIELVDFVREAAKHRPVLRTVGWDVGITNDGPVLIEGNHNWGKIIWQQPYNQGFKYKIKNYKQ